MNTLYTCISYKLDITNTYYVLDNVKCNIYIPYEHMCMYYLQIADNIGDYIHVYISPLYRVISYVIFFRNMIFNVYLIFQHHCINLTKSIICSNLPKGTQPYLGSHTGPFLKGSSFPILPSRTLSAAAATSLSPYQGFVPATHSTANAPSAFTPQRCQPKCSTCLGLIVSVTSPAPPGYVHSVFLGFQAPCSLYSPLGSQRIKGATTCLKTS